MPKTPQEPTKIPKAKVPHLVHSSKTIQALEPVQEAEERVTALQAAASGLDSWLAVKIITTDAEYTAAGEALRICKERLAAAETERKTIVEPLNKVVKHVNQKFAPYTATLKQIIEHASGLATGYLEMRRMEERRLAEKAARAAARSGARQLAEDIREQAATSRPVPQLEGIQLRERWTYTVEFPQRVPDEYWVIDEAKLAKLAGPDHPEIPGVRFHKVAVFAKG